jgi:hypothetical protein
MIFIQSGVALSGFLTSDYVKISESYFGAIQNSQACVAKFLKWKLLAIFLTIFFDMEKETLKKKRKKKEDLHKG